jgi:hypothetical protein
MHMTQLSRRARPFLAGIALFLSASGLLAQARTLAGAGGGAGEVLAQERWFHVRVSETGVDPTEVAINLPLSLVEAALRALPAQIHREIDLELNEIDFELADLRQFWQDVRGLEDATFVTVESADATVRIAKEGALLVARTTERSGGGAQVDVRFPFAVLDALFQGTGEHQVDLVGAARALAEYGDGDIVTVDDGETRVRVWVDDVNEPAV